MTGQMDEGYGEATQPKGAVAEHAAQSAEWHDGLLLGHPEMDATHQEFVELSARLRSPSPSSVREDLEALVDHTTGHFDAEDSWMATTNFPARECHIDEHGAVMASLRGVLEQVRGGDTSRVRHLADALAEWFPGHARYMDAPLSQWLCKQRFGAAPVVVHRLQPSVAAAIE